MNKISMKKLGLFLMSYHRPQFIHESIESILAQKFADFNLIVSENSVDDQVWIEVQKYKNDPKVRLINRHPSLGSLDHFNTLLRECKSYEYAMMFHDDDVLMPMALEQMMNALETNKELSAVSCNGFIIDQRRQTSELFNPNLISNRLISTSKDFIKGYLLKTLGHTPFPAYIYRTRFIHDHVLSSEQAGKHSDVTFLIGILSQGPFLWLSQPLMRYRYHSSNDSAAIRIRDIFKLSIFFIKKAPSLAVAVIIYFSKNLIKKVLLEFKFRRQNLT